MAKRTVFFMTDNEIVGLTLYGEARGEPIEGIIAVGSVIRNRLQTHHLGARTYSAVCLALKQFSCWNRDNPEYKLLDGYREKVERGESLPDMYWHQCLFIGSGIVSWDLRDNTKGATHYLRTDEYQSPECPKWAREGRVVATIGNHTFLIAN